MPVPAAVKPIVNFLRHERAATAVEFGFVALPLITLLLAALQVGLYFVHQAALDAGVRKTAEQLLTANITPVPSSGLLLQQVRTNSGVALAAAATTGPNALTVALVPVATVASSGAVPFGTVDMGDGQSAMVLAARMGTLVVPWADNLTLVNRSFAFVRRRS